MIDLTNVPTEDLRAELARRGRPSLILVPAGESLNKDLVNRANELPLTTLIVGILTFVERSTIDYLNFLYFLLKLQGSAPEMIRRYGIQQREGRLDSLNIHQIWSNLVAFRFMEPVSDYSWAYRLRPVHQKAHRELLLEQGFLPHYEADFQALADHLSDVLEGFHGS